MKRPKTVLDRKTLFENHSLRLAGQVADARLKMAGITLGKYLGLPKRKKKKGDFSAAFIKRLAGG